MDNKTLTITIVLVFVVGLVLGNITSTPTGQVTRSDQVTGVSIDQRNINAGDILTVTVIPGSKGADTKYSVYRENTAGARIRMGLAGETEYCRSEGATCSSYKQFTVRTLTTWEQGSYYVQILDKGTNSYVRAYFFIN